MPSRVYELMIIVDSDVDDAANKAVLDRVTEMVEADGGTVPTVDNWGRRRFAYEINHKNEGVYTVLEIITEAANLDDVDRFLRLADDVVRHKLIRLPDSEAIRRGLLSRSRLTQEDLQWQETPSNWSATSPATPELRFTPNGAAVANFGLAVNRRWRNQQTNEWEEQTSFFDVVCWRELAENVAESLDRGSRVHGGRATRAAVLGDPGGREALQGRGRRRRGRPQPPLGDRIRSSKNERRGGDGWLSTRPAPDRAAGAGVQRR